MENDFRLIHPSTFVDGEKYLLKEQLADETVLVSVTFVAGEFVITLHTYWF